MRNRFVVALVFTVPIVLWSNVGKNLLGGEVATPFGIDRAGWRAELAAAVRAEGQAAGGRARAVGLQGREEGDMR
jgi:hypothetical protein